MSVMIVGFILLLMLVLSMLYEPRSFWNALLLLAALGFLVLGMSLRPGITTTFVVFLLVLTPLAFLAAAVFLIVNGFVMLKKEGRSLQNILSLLLGLAMIGGSILTLGGLYHFQDISVARSVFYLVLSLEFYVAFAFIALLIYSLLYTCLPKRINCDYIIVHGCGLNDGDTVTPLLQGRVDKAVVIYHKCRERSKSRKQLDKQLPKIVLSGGKGSDEKLSEAAAMKNYLIKTGFPKRDIILEDRSTTTFENLRNVRDMLDVDGVKNRYLFVTNNYHVFRTSLFAKKLKMKAVGVGCRTAAYYWPSAFIREYIAIMFRYKWVFGAIILLWAVLEMFIHL